MVSPEIVSRVNALMSEGFEITPEKLTPSALLFDELGLDSLDVVDMLVHLEEKLGVKVDTSRLVNVRSLQDVYVLVSELLAEPSAVVPAQSQAEAQVSQ